MNDNFKDLLKGIFWGIVVCMLLSLLASCAHTKYVTVPEYHLQYVNHTDSVFAHDSIYVHDSIFSFMRGDTVFMNKYKTKYIENLKYISLHDTICKRDSIEVPVVQEVVKTKTDYKGWFVALALVALFGLYFKFKK